MKNRSTGRLGRLFNAVIPECLYRGSQPYEKTTRFPITTFGNDVRRGPLRGFTLIELLVVVLIIGILSAIALPQYQKSVVIADFAQYRSLFREIYRARQLYLMSGGSSSEQDLTRYSDLQLPANMKLECLFGLFSDGGCINGDTKIVSNGKTIIHTGTANSRGYYKKFGYDIEYMLPVHRAAEVGLDNPSQIRCVPKNDKSKSICKILSGGKEATTSCAHIQGYCWLID